MNQLAQASDAGTRAHLLLPPTREHAVGLDRELEYEEMVDDGVAMMRARSGAPSGPLLAGFWCTGPDWESMSESEVVAFTRRLQDVLKKLDLGWMVHCEVIRRVEYRYRRVYFPEAIDDVIDRERAKGGYYYVTDRGLFLTRAPTAFESGLGKRIKDAVVGPSTNETLDEHAERIAAFERSVTEFGQTLGRLLKVRRMRHSPDNDELYQALNLCTNHRFHACVLPEVPNGLNRQLSRDLSWANDTMKHAGDYVTIVGIKRFPRRCAPLFLRELTLLGSDVRWSTRFIPLDHAATASMLGALQRVWTQKIMPFFSKLFNVAGTPNRDALDKSNEVAEAIRAFDAGLVRYGLYTTTLVFRGQTQEEADARADAAKDVLNAQRFEALTETVNKMSAWLGSLPGHGAQNARKTPMHTGHLANLLALTEEYAGEATHPCPLYERNSPPLMQVRNWSGGQYNLNLHAAGTGEGSTLGHTALFGPSTHGKTFALAYMCSQHMKFKNSIGPAQVFFLDVGRSMLAFTLARSDGAHFQLGGEQGLRLCPLAPLDSPEDRAWASVWLQELFTEQGVKIDDTHRARIDDAVSRLAACSSGPADRTLTHLLPHLLGSGLENALNYYTSGAGADVLNGDSVALDDLNGRGRKNFITFELGALAQYGDAIANPARSCLWRMVYKRCDHRPTMLVVDELFVSLPEQRDVQKLKDAINNMAKRNCAVVIATQQVDQVAESKLANAVFECCPTKILLPNPGMTEESIPLYRGKLGMTAAQVELLKRAEPKRWYMVLKGGLARLISFDAGPVAKTFFGARSEEELLQIESLAKRLGPDWPEAWLRQRGLADDADAFQQHRLSSPLRGAR